jgi:hypothetical protein
MTSDAQLQKKAGAQLKQAAEKEKALRKAQRDNRKAVIALFRFVSNGRGLRVDRKGSLWHVTLREGPWSLHHEGEDLATVVQEMTALSGGRLSCQ